ncbi:MAG TPA: hypothetical protein VKB76_20850, partial [Ktedonobacterales bacterium]|nr:hypothetical protein [Ktedonobacterales bacterium]
MAGLIYLILWGETSLRTVLGARWLWLALGTGCALAASWYAPALMAGQGGLGHTIMRENTGHFLPGSMGGTGEAARPLYYIIARLIGGSLPWCLLIVPTAIALASGAICIQARPPVLYQLSMLLAVVLFFSVASAKRDEYILPAMPSLAIVAAAAFAIDPGKGIGQRWALFIRKMMLGGAGILLAAFVVVVFLAARLGASPAILHVSIQSSDLGYVRLFVDGMAQAEPVFLMLIGASLIGVIILMGGLRRAREGWAASGLVLMVLGGVLIFNGVLRPRLASARSPIRFATQVRARIGYAPLY